MKDANRYRALVWQQFKKNRLALVSFYLLIIFIVIALFSPFIANRQPYYAQYRGKGFYPLFRIMFGGSKTDSTLNPVTGKYEKLQFDITDWRQLPLDKVIWAPIPYSPAATDQYNAGYAAPAGRQVITDMNGQEKELHGILRHHLGTNEIGQDIAAGLVHGTSIALRVGLITMSIAILLGVFFGSLAGYYGDNSLKISRGETLFIFPGILLGWFYGFTVRAEILSKAFHSSFMSSALQIIVSLAIFAMVIFIAVRTGRLFKKNSWMGASVAIPVDMIISRLTEIFNSLPSLLLIITVSALFVEKSLTVLMAIIGCLSAPHIARLVRGEFIRIRHLDYIQSARALGIGHLRIIFRHILPNAIAPVIVYAAFGAAGAIVAESGLSFLSIGVPPETVTWGSILSAARQNYNAWWLSVFPGAAIFITVTIYNLIGEGLRDALDPRLRS